MEKGILSQKVHGAKINLAELGLATTSKKIDVYDPWKNVWTNVAAHGPMITLPDFKRSVVIKLTSR